VKGNLRRQKLQEAMEEEGLREKEALQVSGFGWLLDGHQSLR